MSQLIFHIKKYIPISDLLEKELISAFDSFELNKKETFIRAGQINVSLAFIQSGILRCYHLKEGKEVTNDFFFENEFVTDYASFLNSIPAKQNFEAIQDTVILKIPRERLFHLSEQFPELKVWGGKMAESLFTQSLDKNATLKSDGPEERYNRILTEKPEIIHKVPLHYIASYLGITQVHLSRIRNKRK